MNVRTMGLLKLLFAGIIIMVAGILIMAHTGSFLLIVMISAGIGVFFDGIYTLFAIGRWKLTGATKVLAIIKGICNILVGISAVTITIMSPGDALMVMIFIFAFDLVFSAIVAFENAIVSSAFGIQELRSHFIIEGIIMFLLSMLMFFRPVETLVSVIRVIAIFFMVGGVFMTAIAIVGFIRKPKVQVSVEIGEAEIVDGKTAKKKK